MLLRQAAEGSLVVGLEVAALAHPGERALDAALHHDGAQDTGLARRIDDGFLRHGRDGPEIAQRRHRPRRSKIAGIAEHHQDRSGARSEEHTSELQSLMRNSYAVLCLK